MAFFLVVVFLYSEWLSFSIGTESNILLTCHSHDIIITKVITVCRKIKVCV